MPLVDVRTVVEQDRVPFCSLPLHQKVLICFRIRGKKIRDLWTTGRLCCLNLHLRASPVYGRQRVVVVHDYSCGVRDVGSTERASAILRMVRGWTSVRPLVSILHTVLWFRSALSANSLCERNLCSRAALTFSPSILTSTSIVRLLCLNSQYPLYFKTKIRQKQIDNIQ